RRTDPQPRSGPRRPARLFPHHGAMARGQCRSPLHPRPSRRADLLQMAGRRGRRGAARCHPPHRLRQRHLESPADPLRRPHPGRRLGAPAQPAFRRPDAARTHERRRRHGPRGGAPVSRRRARPLVLTPPLKRVEWPAATRVIASRYPPIDLYERVSPDPAVWEARIAAEMLTNPRLRDEAGDIRLVPPEERISGPGASYVMAPFTHLNPKGGRFSDATHGAYYAASDLPTAIAETAYHFARFAADSADGPRYED